MFFSYHWTILNGIHASWNKILWFFFVHGIKICLLLNKTGDSFRKSSRMRFFGMILSKYFIFYTWNKNLLIIELVWHKKIGPDQNILGPVKGQGMTFAIWLTLESRILQCIEVKKVWLRPEYLNNVNSTKTWIS